MSETTRPLLGDVLPAVSDELVAGLRSIGRDDLAEQIRTLRIWDRCGCDDSFCNSFYVGQRPSGAWSEEGDHENVMPDVGHGMIVLDVVSDMVRYVEVLDRPEIRSALRTAALPPS